MPLSKQHRRPSSLNLVSCIWVRVFAVTIIPVSPAHLTQNNMIDLGPSSWFASGIWGRKLWIIPPGQLRATWTLWRVRTNQPFPRSQEVQVSGGSSSTRRYWGLEIATQLQTEGQFLQPWLGKLGDKEGKQEPKRGRAETLLMGKWP